MRETRLRVFPIPPTIIYNKVYKRSGQEATLPETCTAICTKHKSDTDSHTRDADTKIPPPPSSGTSSIASIPIHASACFLFAVEKDLFLLNAASIMLRHTCPIVTARCKLTNTAYPFRLHRRNRTPHRLSKLIFLIHIFRWLVDCFFHHRLHRFIN